MEALGVSRDSLVMMHSSFSGFSRAGYDAEKILKALVEYMVPGTLLFPTMSWRYVKPENPVFGELATPSNVGILTEIFRKKFATRRSLHPTHSVAGKGALTDILLEGHHLDDTPCSKRSPFGMLADHQGHVVMLGIGMDCCTLVHHVEETVAPDVYLRPAVERETYTCRDRHDSEVTVYLRRHLFLPRDYWQFQDMLAADGKLRVYSAEGITCRGFRAADMVACIEKTLLLRPDAIIAQPGQRYRMM